MKKEIILADIIRKASEPLAEYIYAPGKDNLQGMCGISSYSLYKALMEINIPATLQLGVHKSYGTAHCWVETDKVIDITATQFGRPEAVYITAPDKAELCLCGEVFNYTAFMLRSYQDELPNWRDQSPMIGKGKNAHEKIMEKVYSFLSAPSH